MGKKVIVVFVLCACLLFSVLAYEILSQSQQPVNQPQSQTGTEDGGSNVTDTGSTANSQSDTDQTRNQQATNSKNQSPQASTNPTPSAQTPVAQTPLYGVKEKDHDDPLDYVWNSSDVVNIVLKGNAITVTSHANVTVEGSKVTITSAGTYMLSGSLSEGQIIVSTEDNGTVRLILNGVNVNCSTSAPIYITRAKKAIIILEANTQNYVTDGASYIVNADGDPNGAIFSTADLTIYGTGSLNVNAKYNDGISSKDGLIIKSGNIIVSAKDDGIRGKDYLIIKDGQIKVNSGGDGLKSDNDKNITRGYISIETGVIQINAGGDAIEAETDIMITSGQISVTSGGGSSNNVVAGNSAKGIKAKLGIIINGGIFTANCADDAINSNGAITINGGSFTLSTGDDAIHADASLTINNGDFNIIKSYEGIESAIITINKGTIRIRSSDDGINIAGGKDGSGIRPGPGRDAFTSGNYHLYINGGYIYVLADGDGIDANGAITMTGGHVIVNGPETFKQVAIDHDGGFKMTGGFLLAVGSIGVSFAPAQGPSSISTQYSLIINFNSSLSADTLVHLRTRTGQEIFTFKPINTYQTVVFSSPSLAGGTTYEIFYGGSSTGTVKDGLYIGGEYTPGTRYIRFTISSIITKLGPPAPPPPPKP